MIVDNFIFFGKRKTESKKHLVILSITNAYSNIYEITAGYLNRF